MTDHLDEHADFEARLRGLLADEAGAVDATLSGPELRRLHDRPSTNPRRWVAAVGAAAAVVVVALATQHLGGSSAPHRAPAGHPDPSPSTSAPLHPAPPPSAEPSGPDPTAAPTAVRSSAPRRSVSRSGAPTSTYSGMPSQPPPSSDPAPRFSGAASP